MKKRVFGILLSAVLILSAMGFAIPMTAMADSMMVVTVGADLTEEQKNMILRYFNVAGQSYTTITVTNDDEWRHLGGYMSRDIVGYKTISCALIRPSGQNRESDLCHFEYDRFQPCNRRRHKL